MTRQPDTRKQKRLFEGWLRSAHGVQIQVGRWLTWLCPPAGQVLPGKGCGPCGAGSPGEQYPHMAGGAPAQTGIRDSDGLGAGWLGLRSLLRGYWLT